MSEREITDSPMVPLMYQLAVHEAYVKSLRLLVAYGVLAGFIRIV